MQGTWGLNVHLIHAGQQTALVPQLIKGFGEQRML